MQARSIDILASWARIVGSADRLWSRCSSFAALVCRTAASTAAWHSPTRDRRVAEIEPRHHRPSISSNPPPAARAGSCSGTSTSKVIGLDALPRSPIPCQSPGTAIPPCPAGTATDVDRVGVGVQRRGDVAHPRGRREVTQLLRGRRGVTPSPLRRGLGDRRPEVRPRARLGEGQRRQRSAARPATVAGPASPGGGAAATVIAALTCIR